jgi:acetyl-CoA C-acetyltransferase
MVLDPRTPVLVGVGQVTDRPGSRAAEGEHHEPLQLMVRAVRAALADAGGTSSRLLSSVGSLRVVRCFQWNVPDPGALVAGELGIAPPESLYSTNGGTTPQAFLADGASAIANGHLDAMIVVGAECGYTRALARRSGQRTTWTSQVEGTPPARPFGTDRAPSTELESARGVLIPIHAYPLIENAIRTEAGWTLAEHRGRIGTLWSRFSEAAAANPFGWFTSPVSPDKVVEPGARNRMVSFPYTKLCTANAQVDQGAAFICCAAETAAAAGVPSDRWIFPLSSADANDHWFLSERADLSRSPAIDLAGRAALDLAGVGIDDVAVVDLYSCFPCVVQIAAVELGLDLDGDISRLTLTGGLTFGGGPGNNYVSHGIASVATALRGRPGSVGMATGLGWFATKHAVGLYSTEPPTHGFRSENVQASVDALPRRRADPDATGPAEVETFTVTCDREGAPERGIVACRTGPSGRAWANVTDPDQLAVLMGSGRAGWSGALRPGGLFDLAGG